MRLQLALFFISKMHVIATPSFSGFIKLLDHEKPTRNNSSLYLLQASEDLRL